MSIHDSEHSRGNKIEPDNNSDVLPIEVQGAKRNTSGQLIDPNMDSHIISSIESQLPALIEFSRLGYQKDNISVPDLNLLQDKIEQSIRDLDKSSLPARVIKAIAQVKSFKGISKFSSFIRGFIKFKQENYKDNSTPQAALFYAQQKQQNVQASSDKKNDTLNLLASRLTHSLSETFTIINTLSQRKPESWLSWNTFVEREREAFYNANANITGHEQPAEALRKGELRVKLQPNDPFELMKVNSLINAQLWEEKKRRENALGLPALKEEYDAIDTSDVGGMGYFTNDLSRFGLDQSSGTGRSITALIQSVRLTESAALIFLASHEVRVRAEHENAALGIIESSQATERAEQGYAFCQLIVSSCQKLHPILVQLEVELSNGQPSTQALKDSEPEGIRELLHGVGKKIIAPNKKTAISFKESLPLTPRLLEAGALKFERKLTGIISRKSKDFSPAEIAAILHTGVIVKDKLQQTLMSMAQINQVSATLRFALERFDAVNWLLKKNNVLSGNMFLVKELEGNKDFWKRAVVEEKSKLAKLISNKMDLSEGKKKASLLLKLSDILMSDTHTEQSQQAINAYYIELIHLIEFIFTSEQRMKTIPDNLCSYPDERKYFSKEIIKWMRELQVTRSYLNIEMTDLIGWAPASFSRTGMLAKGIAESHQERKIAWLTQRYGDKFNQSQEEAYDTAFLKFIKDHLPFVAKQKEGGDELLLQRIEIEMKNAAEGKVSYPATMADILSAQKSIDATFRSWSIRRLIRKSLNVSLGSFTLMPSLASLPLRIAIKCLITGAVVTFVINKGGKAVRLGEGSSNLEARKYRRNAFEQLAIKIGVGSLPLASHIIGGVFLWEDFYKGNARDAAKNLAKEVVFELPFMALNTVVDNSVNAVRQKKIAEQEQLSDFFNNFIKRVRENDENSETEIPVTKAKTLNLRDELYRISQGDNPEQAKLAYSLLKNKSIDSIKVTQPEGYVFSQYIMSTREIQLSESATDEEVLHEIAHALSAHQVASGLAYPDSELGIKVKQLDALRERALKAYQEQGGTDLVTLYFLSSPNEFIAGLYSEYSEFTAFLNSIDVDGRSLLLRMLDLLCQLLGLETEQESALTHALGLSDAIMATPVAEEMEGEQQTHPYYQPRQPLPRASQSNDRNVELYSLPSTATSIPNDYVQILIIISELAVMTRSNREKWMQKSHLPANVKKEIYIRLAEDFYIYDQMVTGSDYFAWVKTAYLHWPRNFQSENRIVGAFRLSHRVMVGDFPDGKGLKLILKNSRGAVIFERVYYPRPGFEREGKWKADIESQIREDMLLQGKYNRVSVSHVHNHMYKNPSLVSGTSNVSPNVFVVDGDSLVKNADIRIVDQDPDLEKTTLKTMIEARSLVARLATMSPVERDVWFLRSKLSRDMKKYTGIYLAEYQYIYERMVKGSDYFKFLIDTNQKWPRDFQRVNRIVGVLRLPNSVLTGAFPAGKGFKLILKNSSGDVVFEKIYYPGTDAMEAGSWKNDILSQIAADMLLQDEDNRISVSHIDHAASSRAEVVAGPSNVKMNVFVIDENSQVESADFQIVNEEEGRGSSTALESDSALTGISGNTTPDKALSVDEQLDNILRQSAASEGLTLTQADLDEKYPVTFERKTVNTYGAANFIPPRSQLYTREYTLRDILSGNFYRDENFTLNSFADVYDVDHVPNLNMVKLKKIIDCVEKRIGDKIEQLKYSSGLKSAVTQYYQKNINAIFASLLSSEQNSDVIELISLYFTGRVHIKTVSVNIPGSLRPNVPGSIFSSRCKVPGMVAISKGSLTVLISLVTGKCYVMRDDHINYNIADAISQSLSKKDADNISPEYHSWRNWTLSYGDSTNIFHQQSLLNTLYAREIDKLKSDLNYQTFTSSERATKRLTSYGKAMLRSMAIIAGAVATGGAGNLAAAALLVGVLAEAGDIGLSVLQMNNADRGNEYNEAKNEILVSAIMFTIFSVGDIKELARIAISRRREFLALARKARAFVDKIKRAPGAGDNILKGTEDVNIRADYTRQVLDEGVIEGTITEGQHHELMAGVDAQHPTPSSPSTSTSSLDTSEQTSSSGYQSGSQTNQTPSFRQTQTPNSATEGGLVSGSGLSDGRKPFTKNEVIHNNKNYGYRQYDDYRIYLPEGKDARPDTFMVSGHGNTIGTETVACPKNTTINFYGEHGKLLDDSGLISRKMQPAARVRSNELGELVTEVPIIQDGRITGWRNATLKERIRFTGTSKPGSYKDIDLRFNGDDNPYGAMDLWGLEKEVSAQPHALAPATPRPGGLVTIGENSTAKLSNVVEDMASVSGTGEAVVDVNACRGGWLATLFAKRNTRARPSRRYTEQTRIRSIRPTQNRTGGRLLRKGDFNDTLSPIGTGGREILRGAMEHPKTTLRVLGFTTAVVVPAAGFAVFILYLRGDFDSPAATMNGESVDTEPVTLPSTGEQTLTLTKDEVSARLDVFIGKVRYLSTVLSTYDDNALAALRPLEKQYFGDDDYLDVKDLTQILAFFDAIKNDASGISLKAFLEGSPTPWEIANPNNPFARLGRENVMGFLKDVLR